MRVPRLHRCPGRLRRRITSFPGGRAGHRAWPTPCCCARSIIGSWNLIRSSRRNPNGRSTSTPPPGCRGSPHRATSTPPADRGSTNATGSNNSHPPSGDHPAHPTPTPTRQTRNRRECLSAVLRISTNSSAAAPPSGLRPANGQLRWMISGPRPARERSSAAASARDCLSAPSYDPSRRPAPLRGRPSSGSGWTSRAAQRPQDVSKNRKPTPDSQGGGRQGGTAQRCPTRPSPNGHPAQADPTPTPPCRPTPGTRQRHRRTSAGRRETRPGRPQQPHHRPGRQQPSDYGQRPPGHRLTAHRTRPQESREGGSHDPSRQATPLRRAALLRERERPATPLRGRPSSGSGSRPATPLRGRPSSGSGSRPATPLRGRPSSGSGETASRSAAALPERRGPASAQGAAGDRRRRQDLNPRRANEDEPLQGQAQPVQQRGELRIPAAEPTIGLHRVHRAAGGQQRPAEVARRPRAEGRSARRTRPRRRRPSPSPTRSRSSWPRSRRPRCGRSTATGSAAGPGRRPDPSARAPPARRPPPRRGEDGSSSSGVMCQAWSRSDASSVSAVAKPWSNRSRPRSLATHSAGSTRPGVQAQCSLTWLGNSTKSRGVLAPERDAYSTVGEQPVQGVPELVEHRDDVVPGDRRGGAGVVAVVGDDGQRRVAGGLVHDVAHPGAALLGGARPEVHEEQPERWSRRRRGPRRPRCRACARPGRRRGVERDAVQLGGRRVDGGQHLVDLEVLAELGLVEREPLPAHHGLDEAPVRRGELRPGASSA